MEQNETDTEQTPWWGTFALEEESAGRWDVGPSTLWLYRLANEWRVFFRPSTDPRATDPMLNRSSVAVPIPADERKALLDTEDEHLQVSRYSVRQTESRIALQPALADRPVVSRPEDPLFVPPGESLTLYLSTALWIRIELVETNRLLHEMPSFRMSDTWFGPSTVEGEMCYATRTAGRVRLENVPRRFHRAVTPLRIRNSASDALALERVQLPVEHLALYTTPDDRLWTQGVTMIRSEDREGAGVQVRSGPPSDAEKAELIQKPRKTDRKGLFTSTFSAVGALFSY
jgi:hypothetical protein